MKLTQLFTPFTINGMTLKNRAVMPPMGTGYGNADSTVSERLVEYLARRARGGTGMIITEVCAVDPRGKGFINEIGAFSDDLIPSLAQIPRALHREGAKAAVQLHHAGRETFKKAAGGIPEAPSAIPSVILNEPCEEMSLERIAQVIDAFGKAALRAKKAGFDAVEIHGAHGYLLNQFLSPFSNQRTDQYGGSDENRARFVLEVVEAVRGEVGIDFPVFIRVSTDELVRGGYDLEFMKWLAPQLVSAGVNAIHASVGVYSTPGNLSIASMDTEQGFNLFRARAIKEAAGVPVIGVGRISLEMAEKAIADGDADLIAFGRQHLTDPDFINKAREGKFEDIRMCVACNQGCIDRLSFEMKSATCTFNPECGRELKGIPKAETGKKVWVIGAGPAGLSAAMYAAQRGHEVEVFERDAAAGGQIKSASRPPHKDTFMDWVDWSVRQLKKQDVKINLSQGVTQDILKSGRPDAVILAAGAYPVMASIPGIDGENVFDARDVLEGKVDLASPAVILGAGYVGMETADFLIARGIDVAIIEMLPYPPVPKLSAHGYWLHRRIRKAGGRIMLNAAVTGIENTTVHYTQNDEDRTEPAAMVITAMGAKSDNALEVVLKELGIDYRMIGDAVSPRRLLEAIHEGYKAAVEI
jgi:2,4-dienoyl-CoA reductase-like NADH-dependent reductase (Old Yellow Enzyme family)/NADPH-dependent 2,4-dienoyl-CoA reductase/sulfur reductase-like enzyme